ncbi:hypothetical protein FRC03_000392 [Tulasnella sp. 419]|nr:hypothetical protein FRC03_000392 [Tulasnella sp. 419]
MRKEAGEMYDWGVYICREVALSGNSKTLFDLGTFLHKLFKELASRGQSDEAERVLDEAIQTRRRLAERKQWSYLDKLASSMWRVALHLNTLGHGAAVVSAIREVVNIHRHLVGHNAVVFLPHLACALDGLMVALSGLDMDEDAVKAGEEVLTIWRNLAEHRHEPYLSSLACSQYSLVLSMERLARHEEAKGIELEAAATCRRLMVKNEAPPFLRAAIKERLLEPSVMSRSLLLDTIDKAIERAATKSSQDAWMSVLIRRLRDLAMYRRNYERYEDSARSEEVAIDVVRDLLKTGGEAQLRSLAQSLCRLAFDLSKLGRVDDVTKIGEEVVEAFQLLVQTDQIQGNHNELEVALHHLSLNLFRRGIREGTTWVDNEIIVNISELAALVSGRDN